ncbi:MAG: beta-xylosidase [Phycisphaerae bacterium]|nr:beta-xylosidase [Phycisphaerae bacterium]
MALNFDARAAGTPLKPIWNVCVGAGRANEGLRAAWQEQLGRVTAECGFRYLRFHGLFHDDMFVYREVDGQAVYGFDYVDALFDAMLEIGIRPFVELGFCPGDLAVQRETVFWWKAHGSPPRDLARWCELVAATMNHWIDRYGAEEVRRWYFEVWNEPNLGVFFAGTQEQYLELYKATAQTLKAIDPALRVGGPATSNFYPRRDLDAEDVTVRQAATFEGVVDLYGVPWQGVWIREFLAYCAAEDLPVDFVSTHPYPTDFALDGYGNYTGASRPVDSLRRDLRWVRNVMADSPYAGAEVHLTEWSSSPSPVDHTHDYLQAATYVVRSMLDAADLADSVSYWVFTDIFEEKGAPPGLFHGGFGMVTRRGIVKPVFHAYRFLGALGDEQLARGEWGIATREAQTGKLAALLYNYPATVATAVPVSQPTRDAADETLATGTAQDVAVTVTNLPAGAEVVVEILDTAHGDALSAWKAMGCPEAPSGAEEEALYAAGEATDVQTHRADAGGRLALSVSLDPWALALIRQA